MQTASRPLQRSPATHSRSLGLPLPSGHGEMGTARLPDRSFRRHEISFVEHEVGKGVAVERANEVVERLVQHLGQAAAPGDDALIAGGKTFDKREIRLGRAYD